MPCRLTLRVNTSSKKRKQGQCSGVVVKGEVDFDAIIDVAAAKLKLNSKEKEAARLFVYEHNGRARAGTELVRGDAQLEALLCNDTVLNVSVGEDFISKSGLKMSGAAGAGVAAPGTATALLPPRGPNDVDADAAAAAGMAAPHSGDEGVPAPLPPSTVAPCGKTPVLQDYDLWRDRFPVFPAGRNVLPAVREAVAGCDAFVESDRGAYIAFDYKTSRTVGESVFPDPAAAPRKSRKRWHCAARRECRGLLLCARTGQVLGRRFHKFFNYNEFGMPETHGAAFAAKDVDGCFLSEKVDGSLVSAVFLSGTPATAAPLWVGKSAVVDALERWVAAQAGGAAGCGAVQLSRHWSGRNVTALFEWCEAGRCVGVIEHAASSLTLLALRDNATGEYLSRETIEASAAEHGVDVAKAVDLAADDAGDAPESMDALAARVAEWGGDREGVVVTLQDGRMFKVKTRWYVALAAASKAAGGGGKNAHVLSELLKARPTLDGVPAKEVHSACLHEAADDVLALCATLLTANGLGKHAAALAAFHRRLSSAVAGLHRELDEWVASARLVLDPAATAFAQLAKPLQHRLVEVGVASGWPHQLLVHLAHGNGGAARAELVRVVRGMARRGGAGFAHVTGVAWRLQEALAVEEVGDADGGDAPAAAAVTLPSGAQVVPVPSLGGALFDACAPLCTAALRAHVLDVYLPRKVENYTGRKGASAGFGVPSRHLPAEGKLKGLWEPFAKDGVIDLRVDLQPQKRAQGAYTDHVGDLDYANWQVQYGANKKCKTSSKPARGGTHEARGAAPPPAAGAFAGVLMATDVEFSTADLRRAFEESFERRCYVKLERGVRGEAPAPPWRLYCDLDGVLADFDGGVAEATARHAAGLSQDDLWAAVGRTPQFFARLAPLPGAPELAELLWRACAAGAADGSVVPKVVFLTGVPRGAMGKAAEKQKTEWVRRHIAPIFAGLDAAAGGGQRVAAECVPCMSYQKGAYSGPGHVLIDDRPGPCRDGWTAQGGVFLHHQDMAGTAAAIQRLLSLPADAVPPALLALKAPRHPGVPVLEFDHADAAFDVDPNQVHWVCGEEGAAACVEALARARVVGFDAEWRPDDMTDENKAHYDPKAAAKAARAAVQARIEGAGAKNAAAVLQLAVEGEDGAAVFVVDMLALAPYVEAALVGLLADESVVKVGFGVQHDLPRICCRLPRCAVRGVADVQAAVAAAAPAARMVRSLEAAAQYCGVLLPGKTKRLQASDWEARPLSADQMRYAALDAAVLLRMYRSLCGGADAEAEEGGEMAVGAALRPVAVDPFPTSAARAEYCLGGKGAGAEGDDASAAGAMLLAVFLSEESKAALLRRHPAVHPTVHGGHLTLSFRPSLRTLVAVRDEGLLGASLELEVVREAADASAQAVAVRLGAVRAGGSGRAAPRLAAVEELSINAHPHVTISTAAGVPPNASNALLAGEAAAAGGGPGLLLQGTLGVTLPQEHVDAEEPAGAAQPNEAFYANIAAAAERDLAPLPGKVLRKVMDFFAATPQCGGRVKLPAALTAQERLYVHEFAEQHGLSTRSEGAGTSRRLTLSIPKRLGRGEGRAPAEPLGHSLCTSTAALAAWLERHQPGTRPDASATSPVDAVLHLPCADSISDAAAPPFRVSIPAECRTAACPWRDWFAAVVAGDVFPPPLAAAAAGVVVVLRGLPGCGKSTVAAALRAGAARAGGAAVTCSADGFFARGAGKSKKELAALGVGKDAGDAERYSATYSSDLLPAAHAYCRAEFAAALEGAAELVLVDNTHVKTSDYKYYTRTAGEAGYAAVVVELPCPSDAALSAFSARGTHSVPGKAMALMRSRWEPASEGNVVRVATSSSAPPQHAAASAMPLSQWLSEHRCLHHAKRRARTHMLMRVGPQPLTFVSVHAAVYEEFLRVYAADVLACGSPAFLLECATAPSFRVFLDVDFVGFITADAPQEWLAAELAAALHAVLTARADPDRRIIVTGCAAATQLVATSPSPAIRLGLHLHAPGVVVNNHDMRRVREEVVLEMRRRVPEGSHGVVLTGGGGWDGVIDAQVYAEGATTLRMVGSRKADKRGLDVGRVYSLLSAADGAGRRDAAAEQAYAADPVSLLRAVSIRTDSSA